MEKTAQSSQRELGRRVNESLTAISALLAAADAQPGVPDDTQRCLRQIGAQVKELADACHLLLDGAAAPRTRPAALVHGLTRLDLVGRLGGPAPTGHAGTREANGGDHPALDPELAARLLERVRPSGTPRPEQLAKLTPQERRIFDLIGQGCTNRQIAERLFLAEKTVKNYVSNMLRKLGMERRTQAAVFATFLDGPLRVASPGSSRPA